MTDDDGASASTSAQTLVVCDAAAGYTTASGYIQGVMLASKTYLSHTVRYTPGAEAHMGAPPLPIVASESPTGSRRSHV